MAVEYTGNNLYRALFLYNEQNPAMPIDYVRMCLVSGWALGCRCCARF